MAWIKKKETKVNTDKEIESLKKQIAELEKKEQRLEQPPNIENPDPINEGEITLVVKELPVQEIRRYKREDGTIINLKTVEEALTEIYNARAE